MRRLVIVFVLACLSCAPGCLAVAAGGVAYMVGKGKEADAQRKQARLDYVARRRAAGASTEEILAEIKATDPDWYEEIEDGKYVLEVPLK